MILEIENIAEVFPFNDRIVKKNLKQLKSYGPNSYATLTDSEGNYLQVAGGRVTCFVEKYDANKKRSTEDTTLNQAPTLKMEPYYLLVEVKYLVPPITAAVL